MGSRNKRPIVLDCYLKLAYWFRYSSYSRKRAAVVVGEVRLLRLRGVRRDNKTIHWNRANLVT
jgi:hypothetical protein